MHIIGLLISNAADRRLVSEFLQASNHSVRDYAPAEVDVLAWTGASMVIADAGAARQHATRLAALKRQTPEIFVPMLIALPQNESAAVWYQSGFDDVLRLPMSKSELTARVDAFLRIRELLNADVVADRERRRLISRQVLKAQEEERKRLSRDLHDELGQNLAVLKMSLAVIGRDFPAAAEKSRSRVQEAVALTDVTIQQMRQIARDLRPVDLDELGLYAALETLCNNFAARSQVIIHCNFGGEEPALTGEVRIGIYRFVQEALTNVAKHAQAQKVRVSFDAAETELCLSVTDNGQGFDMLSNSSAPSGIGLLGMRERIELLGGQIEIVSRPGEGTRLLAHIPLFPGS